VNLASSLARVVAALIGAVAVGSLVTFVGGNAGRTVTLAVAIGVFALVAAGVTLGAGRVARTSTPYWGRRG